MRNSMDRLRSLKQYAQIGDVSVAHLSRCFAAVSGLTLREKFRRLRTEKACRLLTSTSLKIAAVAKQLGLRDPSQFVEQFRRETGTTPGMYRRRHLLS